MLSVCQLVWAGVVRWHLAQRLWASLVRSVLVFPLLGESVFWVSVLQCFRVEVSVIAPRPMAVVVRAVPVWGPMAGLLH